MTVGVTIHDKRSNLRQKGVGHRKLRNELRTRFGTICHQEGINDAEVGGGSNSNSKDTIKPPGPAPRPHLVV